MIDLKVLSEAGGLGSDRVLCDASSQQNMYRSFIAH